MPKIINRTVARTSLQDTQNYMTSLFSEWCVAGRMQSCEPHLRPLGVTIHCSLPMLKAVPHIQYGMSTF